MTGDPMTNTKQAQEMGVDQVLDAGYADGPRLFWLIANRTTGWKSEAAVWGLFFLIGLALGAFLGWWLS